MEIVEIINGIRVKFIFSNTKTNILRIGVFPSEPIGYIDGTLDNILSYLSDMELPDDFPHEDSEVFYFTSEPESEYLLEEMENVEQYPFRKVKIKDIDDYE